MNEISVLIDYVGDRDFIYQKIDGLQVVASVGVEFNGGIDSIRSYMNDIFYKSPDYDPTRSEFNYYERYILLFDKKLNIVEVRKLKSRYTTSEYYDPILINGLKHSTGHWRKTVEGRDWYVYIVGYRVF
jgi:hypothetical protein